MPTRELYFKGTVPSEAKDCPHIQREDCQGIQLFSTVSECGYSNMRLYTCQLESSCYASPSLNLFPLKALADHVRIPIWPETSSRAISLALSLSLSKRRPKLHTYAVRYSGRKVQRCWFDHVETNEAPVRPPSPNNDLVRTYLLYSRFLK